MFWMMNDMGPHGRGMRQGGTCRTGGRGGRGGLSVFPGALIGIFSGSSTVKRPPKVRKALYGFIFLSNCNTFVVAICSYL